MSPLRSFNDDLSPDKADLEPALPAGSQQNALFDDLALPSSLFAWSNLGRPLCLLVLEAKLFSTLVILADQYTRTQSLPWPLHPLPPLWHAAWWRVGCALWPSTASHLKPAEKPPGSTWSLEMTQQEGSEVFIFTAKPVTDEKELGT